MVQFRALFHQAAVQRLLQALGAYGFLGRQGNHQEFLAHIPSGLANLIEAASDSPQLRLLRNLALCCREVLADQDKHIVLELKRRLSADLQKCVIKFILYGSRARGVDAEDSDLDLVEKEGISV